MTNCSLSGYDSSIDPGITHGFASAAFRVGHTEVPDVLHKVDYTKRRDVQGFLADVSCT